MPTEEERSPQGRYHHGDLRRALLDAALEILENGGDLSLRAVARRVGVSHAAPYHHFSDRRALVAALAEEALNDFRRALLRAGLRAVDAQERMLEVGVAYVRFALANPSRFRLMFSAELSDRTELPTLQEAFDSAYAVLVRGVQGMLGEGVAEEQVRIQATFSWSLVHGLANLLLDRQVAVEADTPEAQEDLVRSVLRRSMHPAPPILSGTRPPAD